MTRKYLSYHKAIERERINAQRGSGGGDDGGGGGGDEGGGGGGGGGDGGGDDGGGGGGGGDRGGGEVEGGGMRDIGQQTDPTIGEYGMSLLLWGILGTALAETIKPGIAARIAAGIAAIIIGPQA